MPVNKYSDKEKKRIMDRYWEMKLSDPGLSLRQFAGMQGIGYYTFRDWYRDPRYNRFWSMRYENPTYCH